MHECYQALFELGGGGAFGGFTTRGSASGSLGQLPFWAESGFMRQNSFEVWGPHPPEQFGIRTQQPKGEGVEEVSDLAILALHREFQHRSTPMLRFLCCLGLGWPILENGARFWLDLASVVPFWLTALNAWSAVTRAGIRFCREPADWHPTAGCLLFHAV